ncbi:MAG: hypothetical protein JW803_08065 [Endomicrobiales bacterium]|nr:hypothetical protein [Endomicrobiales bacterium]
MMVSSRVLNKASLVFLTLMILVLPLRATTLSTNYASVIVENLGIGASYNLSEVANLPMWVSYGGDVPVNVTIAPVLPMHSELRPGYEPIPDPSWITLGKQEVSLMPDESANIDVTLTIPKDEKYLGKQYQVYLLVQAKADRGVKSGLMVGLALKARILFTVAQKPPTAEELREMRKKAALAAQGVMLNPERFIVATSTGARKAVVTEFVPLKIINSSREKVTVNIEAVEPSVSGISVPRGYEKGKVEDFKISKKRLLLKPDQIENVEMEANLKEEEVKKIFFSVRVEIRSKTLEINKFIRVYIN